MYKYSCNGLSSFSFTLLLLFVYTEPIQMLFFLFYLNRLKKIPTPYFSLKHYLNLTFQSLTQNIVFLHCITDKLKKKYYHRKESRTTLKTEVE